MPSRIVSHGILQQHRGLGVIVLITQMRAQELRQQVQWPGGRRMLCHQAGSTRAPILPGSKSPSGDSLSITTLGSSAGLG